MNINTVVCKIPVETSGSREEKIKACTELCLSNASAYLGENDVDVAPQACPIACA